MLKKIRYTLLGFVILTALPVAADSAFSVKIIPSQIIQGEPFMVQVEGVSKTAIVKKIIFDNNTYKVFIYKSIPTAFVGVSIKQKPGDYAVKVILKNGEALEKTITVGFREHVEAPLGIPKKLGGDTQKSANRLVSDLVKDNTHLANLASANFALWENSFVFPVANATVTDPYGYSRQTGGYSIPHKGTDFRAIVGTPITAMNRGIIRLAHKYRTYGNTIVIDHGLGIQTIYMHLSKIKVKVGQVVSQGHIIGLSGDTGYTQGPHLHLSVRIKKESIDPMKFMELLK